MPDQLPDFPDVATPAARETVPPPFEAIVTRAHRRRRRQVLTTATAVAAVVVVVATGAVLTVGDRSTAPAPMDPSPSPSGSAAPSPAPDPAPDVDTIVRDGTLYSVAAGEDDALLTVWQLCDDGEAADCVSAWQLESASGVRRGRAPGDGPVVHGGADGYVVKAWNRKGIVVGADGSVRPVVDGDARPARAGDVVVSADNRLLLVEPRTGESWPLPPAQGVDRWDQGVVGPDGTLWATALRGNEVWLAWSTDGASWQHHVMPGDRPGNDLPGYVAAAGEHVASVSGSDGATIFPVVDFAVTSDGGRTWTDLGRQDLPFGTVDAMAATSDGTLYVATAGGEQLFRSTDDTWRRFAEMPNPDRVDVLVPAGDHVLARGGSRDAPALLSYDADGQVTPIPLSR